MPKATCETTAAGVHLASAEAVEEQVSPATEIQLPNTGMKFKVVVPTVVVRKGFLATSSQVRLELRCVFPRQNAKCVTAKRAIAKLSKRSAQNAIVTVWHAAEV